MLNVTNLTESLEKKYALNESYIIDTWAEDYEDDIKYLEDEFNIQVTPIHKIWNEVTYKFEGDFEAFANAIGEGYFFSLFYGEDGGHSDDLDEFVAQKNEALKEAIKKACKNINEAEMSAEDRADTDTLRTIYKKIGGKKFNNRNFSDEEKAVLSKYGLDAWGYKGDTKLVTPGKRDLIQGGERGLIYTHGASDDLSPRYDWRGQVIEDPKFNQANLADRARKIDRRAADNDIKKHKYSANNDMEQANRLYDAELMSKNVRDMKYNLDKKKQAQDVLDKADAELADREASIHQKFGASKLAAQQEYDKHVERNQRWEADYQKEIDDILAKHKHEALDNIKTYLSNLNEATMSADDARDSELIRSAGKKLHARTNARLTDDEKDALARHNLVRTDWGHSLVTAGKRPLAHSYDDEKINYARLADVKDERTARREADDDVIYQGDSNANKQNYKRDEYGWIDWSNDITRERAVDANRMSKDVTDMKAALSNRDSARQGIEYAKKKRAEAEAAAEQEWDADLQRATRYNRERKERAAKDIEDASAKIKSLLSKDKNEALSTSEDDPSFIRLQQVLGGWGYPEDYIIDTAAYCIMFDIDIDSLTNSELETLCLLVNEGHIEYDYLRWSEEDINAWKEDEAKVSKIMADAEDYLRKKQSYKLNENLPDKNIAKKIYSEDLKFINNRYKEDDPGFDEYDLTEAIYRASDENDFLVPGQLYQMTRDGIFYNDPERDNIWYDLGTDCSEEEWNDMIRSGELIQEALSEAVHGEERIIPTGLKGTINNEILNSVIGQMSDGMWENSPGMDKYWVPVEINSNNDIVVENEPYIRNWAKGNQNPYFNMDDAEVKKFFANKIKRIAQQFLHDNNMNPYTEWNAENQEVCYYLNYHEDVTIADAYNAYMALRG